jgi:hypothetical protein
LRAPRVHSQGAPGRTDGSPGRAGHQGRGCRVADRCGQGRARKVFRADGRSRSPPPRLARRAVRAALFRQAHVEETSCRGRDAAPEGYTGPEETCDR